MLTISAHRLLTSFRNADKTWTITIATQGRTGSNVQSFNSQYLLTEYLKAQGLTAEDIERVCTENIVQIDLL